jgi:hypothetical protein
MEYREFAELDIADMIKENQRLAEEKAPKLRLIKWKKHSNIQTLNVRIANGIAFSKGIQRIRYVKISNQRWFNMTTVLIVTDTEMYEAFWNNSKKAYEVLRKVWIMAFKTKREAKEIADSLGLSVYKGMNGKWYME